MRKLSFIGLLVFILASSLMFFGCNNDSGDSGLIDQEGSNLTFSQTVSGQVMRVVISRNAVPDTSRNVITPQNNDHYRIWLAGESISYGRIERGAGSIIIFIPSSGARFEGTLSGATLIIPAVPLPAGGTVAFSALQGTSPGAGSVGSSSGAPTGNSSISLRVYEEVYEYLKKGVDSIFISLLEDAPNSTDLAALNLSAFDPENPFAANSSFIDELIAGGMVEVPSSDPGSWPRTFSIDLFDSDESRWGGSGDFYVLLLYLDTGDDWRLMTIIDPEDNAYAYSSSSGNFEAKAITRGANTLDWYDLTHVVFDPSTANVAYSTLKASGNTQAFKDGEHGDMEDIVSSNSRVATAELTGTNIVVTPHGRGEAVLTVTDKVGFTVEITVTVIQTGLASAPAVDAAFAFKFPDGEDYGDEYGSATTDIVIAANTGFRVTDETAVFNIALNDADVTGGSTVASATAATDNLAVTVLTPGSVTLTIEEDVSGDTATISFTIDPDGTITITAVGKNT